MLVGYCDDDGDEDEEEEEERCEGTGEKGHLSVQVSLVPVRPPLLRGMQQTVTSRRPSILFFLFALSPSFRPFPLKPEEKKDARGALAANQGIS